MLLACLPCLGPCSVLLRVPGTRFLSCGTVKHTVTRTSDHFFSSCHQSDPAEVLLRARFAPSSFPHGEACGAVGRGPVPGRGLRRPGAADGAPRRRTRGRGRRRRRRRGRRPALRGGSCGVAGGDCGLWRGARGEGGEAREGEGSGMKRVCSVLSIFYFCRQVKRKCLLALFMLGQACRVIGALQSSLIYHN